MDNNQTHLSAEVYDIVDHRDVTGCIAPRKLRAGKDARAEKARESREEKQVKLTLDAMKDKKLAEERAEELADMVVVKIDSEYENVDAPSPRIIMSRPLSFAIICIIGLMTVVIVLAMKLNQMM